MQCNTHDEISPEDGGPVASQKIPRLCLYSRRKGNLAPLLCPHSLHKGILAFPHFSARPRQSQRNIEEIDEAGRQVGRQAARLENEKFMTKRQQNQRNINKNVFKKNYIYYMFTIFKNRIRMRGRAVERERERIVLLKHKRGNEMKKLGIFKIQSYNNRKTNKE